MIIDRPYRATLPIGPGGGAMIYLPFPQGHIFGYGIGGKLAELTQEEIDRHLDQPHVGHLVTIRSNGSPHVAPVWFQKIEDRVWIMAGRGAVKIRNARRNPRVAISVATDARPYSYVVLEGEATVSQQDLPEIVSSICLKYDGPERGPEFARELLDRGDMALLEVKVDRVMSWVEDD